MASRESVYRRLLCTYPREYRREHQDEILATLVEASAPGRRLPSVREVGGLLVGGLRIRALLAARQGSRTLFADGVRLAVVLLLGLRISSYMGFVGLFPPAVAPLPTMVWTAPILLTLALVAVVRGATRSGLGLVLAGGVASMPWTLPSGLLITGQLGADPTSSQTALLALAAALLLAVTSMQRVQRSWPWWLAAAVIGWPLLNMQAHLWYGQYVLARLDGAHYPYFGAAETFVDSLLTVAVPGVLIALSLIARDPRPSIAAAVSAGAGVLASLYASIATGIELHVSNWSALSGFLVEPTLIAIVAAATTAVTIRSGQRLLRR